MESIAMLATTLHKTKAVARKKNNKNNPAQKLAAPEKESESEWG